MNPAALAMGVNARDYAHHFDWTNIVHRMLPVYASAIDYQPFHELLSLPDGLH